MQGNIVFNRFIVFIFPPLVLGAIVLLVFISFSVTLIFVQGIVVIINITHTSRNDNNKENKDVNRLELGSALRLIGGSRDLFGGL